MLSKLPSAIFANSDAAKLAQRLDVPLNVLARTEGTEVANDCANHEATTTLDCTEMKRRI